MLCIIKFLIKMKFNIHEEIDDKISLARSLKVRLLKVMNKYAIIIIVIVSLGLMFARNHPNRAQFLTMSLVSFRARSAPCSSW